MRSKDGLWDPEPNDTPERPPKREQSEIDSFAFILNVRSLVDFESAEVAPGHIVRRATDEEIEHIRGCAEYLAGSRRYVHSLWEMRWTDDHTHTEELPRELWRYHIIAFRGNNGIVNELSLASCLSSAEPDIGPILMGPLYGPIHNLGHFLQSTEDSFHRGEVAYTDLAIDDLTEISEIWRALEAHDNALLNIQQAVRQLYQLKGLPWHSSLRFLGYFAVLESLLTHSPAT